MKKKSIGILRSFIPILIVLVALMSFSGDKPALYLVGDSTMSDKTPDAYPETGWGQKLPILFSDDLIIENHAKNGRSTRSFIYEGRWDSVMAKLHEGDYVLIQFGHNDGSEKKTERYATPEEYRYNLNKFVIEVRNKGATPVLATPVVRRKFNEDGQFVESHGVYPDIVRDVAEKQNVPLLDMQKETKKYISDLGPEKSIPIYLHLAPGEYENYPEGLDDNTHFSEYGALEMAKIGVAEMKAANLEIIKYLKQK